MTEINESEEPSVDSTASLLIRVREGNSQAREALAGRYWTTLRDWAHGRLPVAARDLVDTDDIVQSAVVRALNRVSTFESRGEGAFLGYLRQVLLNRLYDEARRVKRRPQHVPLDPRLEATHDPSPLEIAIGRQQMERYEAALDRLGDAQRGAVILRLELGMRYRDIAEALEVPTAEAARALVGRGMVRLAQLIRGRHE